MGSDVAIGSIAATVHIVPQQIRPNAPLFCELSEGMNILVWVIRQMIASSTEDEATAGNCRTAWGEVIADWTGGLDVAPCPGCAAAGIVQANASKAASAAAFSARVNASNKLTRFSRFASMTPEMDLPKWEGQAITKIGHFGGRRSRL